MKALLYLLLTLLLFQCDTNQSLTENTEYSSRIARFSDNEANPFNWGATTKEMTAWANASNWKLTAPVIRDNGEYPELEPIRYWKDEQDGEYRQLITLLFKDNHLVAINLVATGGMDTELQKLFNYKYEKLGNNVWMSKRAQAGVKRDDSHEEAGVFYLIGDLKLYPPKLQQP
jgi:hypothetical protein